MFCVCYVYIMSEQNIKHTNILTISIRPMNLGLSMPLLLSISMEICIEMNIVLNWKYHELASDT